MLLRVIGLFNAIITGYAGCLVSRPAANTCHAIHHYANTPLAPVIVINASHVGTLALLAVRWHIGQPTMGLAHGQFGPLSSLILLPQLLPFTTWLPVTLVA